MGSILEKDVVHELIDGVAQEFVKYNHTGTDWLFVLVSDKGQKGQGKGSPLDLYRRGIYGEFDSVPSLEELERLVSGAYKIASRGLDSDDVFINECGAGGELVFCLTQDDPLPINEVDWIVRSDLVIIVIGSSTRIYRQELAEKILEVVAEFAGQQVEKLQTDGVRWLGQRTPTSEPVLGPGEIGSGAAHLD